MHLNLLLSPCTVIRSSHNDNNRMLFSIHKMFNIFFEKYYQVLSNYSDDSTNSPTPANYPIRITKQCATKNTFFKSISPKSRITTSTADRYPCCFLFHERTFIVALNHRNCFISLTMLTYNKYF